MRLNRKEISCLKIRYKENPSVRQVLRGCPLVDQQDKKSVSKLITEIDNKNRTNPTFIYSTFLGVILDEKKIQIGCIFSFAWVTLCRLMNLPFLYTGVLPNH